jgi:NAD(P)-dependent dehydrogenase (short-subunit alcohol dehydrogenase family)
MGRLENKVAVITGGASGIGKATVKLFVAEGAKVIFLDIQEDKGKKLAEELGTDVTFFHGDVRNESDIKGVINLAVANYGRLDCIFNNAGFGGANGYIEEIPTKAFDETIEVLFRSVFLGMKYSAPIMKKQGSGSIISTASVAGILTGMGPHIYSAIKAAIIHLTHSVATELGENNIRVNCICPGLITTSIFGRGLDLDQEASERLATLLKLEFKNLQPIQRTGAPEDVANAALWLASDDSSFITGHALVVDGGISLGETIHEFKSNFEEIVNTLKLGDLDEIIRIVNQKIVKNKYF